MKSADDFQRRNARRTWTAILFLVALLLVALASVAYLVAMLASEGGAHLVTQMRQAAECGQGRLLPLAAAIERHRRGKGYYPKRVEDVYPVYLPEERMLRCPVDPDPKRQGSSFIYRAPQPGREDVPVLECPHHGVTVLQVRARNRIDPGHTEWQLQAVPRTSGQPPR